MTPSIGQRSAKSTVRSPHYVRRSPRAGTNGFARLSAHAEPRGQQLVWSLVGNTAGFGHAINDPRPFWIGDFNGDGRSDILFYFRGDLNWWRAEA